MSGSRRQPIVMGVYAFYPLEYPPADLLLGLTGDSENARSPFLTGYLSAQGLFTLFSGSAGNGNQHPCRARIGFSRPCQRRWMPDSELRPTPNVGAGGVNGRPRAPTSRQAVV